MFTHKSIVLTNILTEDVKITFSRRVAKFKEFLTGVAKITFPLTLINKKRDCAYS